MKRCCRWLCWSSFLVWIWFSDMLLFDAHLDLAMNAIEWNRDLRQPVAAIRESESRMTDKRDRGNNTVSLPAMRAGHVGLCVATLIARVEHDAYSPVQGWRSQEQAFAITQAQRAWYQCMEDCGEMVLISDRASLADAVSLWSEPMVDGVKRPVGFLLSLEGADSILNPDQLHSAWESGLRALGPAHYGPGVYAFGTDSDGPLSHRGKQLLQAMSELRMILDATHLSDQCFRDALEAFDGPVWASHQNCRSLVPHNRQFSDEQLKALVERGAVIGAAMDAWMLKPNWVRGESTPTGMNASLSTVVDHIDHVCQLAGTDRHSGIGSDLDGAFGTEQSPLDVDSITDLKTIPGLLSDRGYTAAAVERICHGNFVQFLNTNL